MKIYLLAFALSFSLGSIAQITIEEGDVRLPVSPDTASFNLMSSGSGALSAGANANWDLSTFFSVPGFQWYMNPTTTPGFPAGTVHQDGQFYVGPAAIDAIRIHYVKDSVSWREVGFSSRASQTDINAYTGGTTDSVRTVDSSQFYNMSVLEFPVNYGDSWSGSVTLWMPLYLTIEQLQWDDDLVSIRIDHQQTDSVVGWGTTTLPNGASAEVLMVHSHIDRLDSTYLNGQPMNQTMAQSLGFPLGDPTTIDKYSLYTQGMNSVLYEYSIVNGQSGQPYFNSAQNIGLEDLDQASLMIFPNPATEFIHVISETPETATLYDLSGRVVREISEDSWNHGMLKIDVSELPQGIYVVHCGEQRMEVVVQ